MTDPTTSQLPAKPRKPLWRRILKWTLRVAIVLAVLLIVVWSVWNFSASRSLRNEIAKIRAAGEPVRFEDLTSSLPEVDEADDAAPYYTAALDLIDRTDHDELDKLRETLDTLITQGTPPTPQFIAAAESLVKDRHSALLKLDLASAMPACSFDIGIENGISSCIDVTISARCLAWAASIRTNFLAFQGQADQAVESTISSLRMLRIFDRQPVLICHLAKISCFSLTVGDIPVILQFTQPSEQALSNLENVLLAAEQSLDLKAVWLAERVYMIELMRNIIPLKQNSHDSPPRPPLMGEWPSPDLSSPFVRRMALGLLRNYARIIDIAGQDWPEVLNATTAFDQRESSTWDRLVVKPLTPSTGQATRIHAQVLAQLRSARLAIMIECYRRDHGKLPEFLADLQAPDGQKLPLDPFTGQDLIYRPTDSGYLVYSLDQDRQDNGGPTTEPVPYGQPTDQGLRVRISPP